MNRVFAGLLAIAFAASCVAQSAPKPIRLKIHSADPWTVKAMLEGIAVRSPEMSTLPGFAGLGNAGGQVSNALFRNGKLIVNPADNSLWFFPNPVQ